MTQTNRPKATAFDQELLDLYDKYAHGFIDRREFLNKAAKFATGTLTALSLLQMLSPTYAWAEQVKKDDPRLKTEYLEYDSPNGHGKMRGYFAKPADAAGPLPAILVIHENRGLNPYIEDVVRRAAIAGYLAFGPDALFPLGGYPGNDDDGRKMQRELDREKIVEDFVSAAAYLHSRSDCTKSVGVTGFCFGGGLSNTLAIRLPNIIKAAVPFYGRQPAAADVPKIKASLLLHYGELDKRVNAGWPAYEEALKANSIDYQAFIYPAANHGFHNDTTPRYDEAAAELAWSRTIAFFDKHLK
ncbi:MAG: dienelactone hydrolase family protein [Verrucomicrobiota bacterium]